MTAVGKSLEHGSARDSHHIAGDVAELDVGTFEQLLDALDEVGALLNQRAAITHQFASLATLAVRNETGLEQPLLQQLSQPLGVFDIRLPPGPRLHVPSVDH